MPELKAQIGVIGGSGLYEMPGFEAEREEVVETPFGLPSDKFVIGRQRGSVSVAAWSRPQALAVGIELSCEHLCVQDARRGTHSVVECRGVAEGRASSVGLRNPRPVL